VNVGKDSNGRVTVSGWMEQAIVEGHV